MLATALVPTYPNRGKIKQTLSTHCSIKMWRDIGFANDFFAEFLFVLNFVSNRINLLKSH